MPDYFSQTNAVPIIEQKKPTTSADSTGEVKFYKFEKDLFKFINVGDASISEEIERNFYKKAFETKSL